MTIAQRARDATMAEVLLGAGDDGAVLISGNGHVRRDLAVPLYLSAAGDKASCVVGILEVDAETEDPRAYVRSAASRGPRYDFAWFTPRVDRPDPCAAFRRGKP
jgi:uncharacterized iron-regulated protein